MDAAAADSRRRQPTAPNPADRGYSRELPRTLRAPSDIARLLDDWESVVGGGGADEAGGRDIQEEGMAATEHAALSPLLPVEGNVLKLFRSCRCWGASCAAAPVCVDDQGCAPQSRPVIAADSRARFADRLRAARQEALAGGWAMLGSQHVDSASPLDTIPSTCMVALRLWVWSVGVAIVTADLGVLRATVPHAWHLCRAVGRRSKRMISSHDEAEAEEANDDAAATTVHRGGDDVASGRDHHCLPVSRQLRVLEDQLQACHVYLVAAQMFPGSTGDGRYFLTDRDDAQEEPPTVIAADIPGADEAQKEPPTVIAADIPGVRRRRLPLFLPVFLAGTTAATHATQDAWAVACNWAACPEAVVWLQAGPSQAAASQLPRSSSLSEQCRQVVVAALAAQYRPIIALHYRPSDHLPQDLIGPR